MRVIGGKLGGRKLCAFKGVSTRPTTDRVREAVFNILAPLLPRKRALDLYAGTGAMGIEALSRGVSEAHFVDSNANATELIKKNIEGLGLEEQAAVFKVGVDSFLSSSEREKARYDLVFIDPPYKAGITVKTLEMIAASKAIAKGAIIVVEAGKREPISDKTLEKGFEGLEQIDFRKYGDSLIYIFKKDE